MRETCQVCLPTGACGKPAVDYDETCGENSDGTQFADRFYMCARHWDEIHGIENMTRLDDVDFDEFD